MWELCNDLMQRCSKKLIKSILWHQCCLLEPKFFMPVTVSQYLKLITWQLISLMLKALLHLLFCCYRNQPFSVLLSCAATGPDAVLAPCHPKGSFRWQSSKMFINISQVSISSFELFIIYGIIKFLLIS